MELRNSAVIYVDADRPKVLFILFMSSTLTIIVNIKNDDEVEAAARNLERFRSKPKPIQKPVIVSSTTTEEVDSRGYRWRHEIHSAEKTQTKQGHWRLKRGTSQEVIKRIEEEERNYAEEQSQASVIPLPSRPVKLVSCSRI